MGVWSLILDGIMKSRCGCLGQMSEHVSVVLSVEHHEKLCFRNNITFDNVLSFYTMEYLRWLLYSLLGIYAQCMYRSKSFYFGCVLISRCLWLIYGEAGKHIGMENMHSETNIWHFITIVGFCMIIVSPSCK